MEGAKAILLRLFRRARGAMPSRSDSPRCAVELAWWASPHAPGRKAVAVALSFVLSLIHISVEAITPEELFARLREQGLDYEEVEW